MPRIAIVTGASSGIGREIATRLAADGFRVVVNYIGRAEKASAAVAAINAAGGHAMAIQANVAIESEVARLFERALAEYGSVDVVVNSAGVVSLSPIIMNDSLSPIIMNDVEQFDGVIATNLRGTFLVLAQAAQHVTDGGRIIALTSSIIAKSMPGYGAYIASKAGVEGLVRVLANELRGRNISVNAVAPGPVATQFFLKEKTPEQIEQMSKVAPMERLGEPIDIARVVSFLAGFEGGWINSQVIRPNGGFA